MTREIPLTKGYVALVDDIDFEFLSQFKWQVVLTGKNLDRPYARRGLVVDGNWFQIPMHRLLTGAPVGVEVDHWNGNGLDNRRNNLRLCSHRQNVANRKKSPGKEFKGVVKRGANVYAALVSNGGKPLQLGTYKRGREAAQVYDAAARRIFGEFAVLNFPDGIDSEADAIAECVLAGGEPPRIEVDKKTRRLFTDEQVVDIRARYAAGGVRIKDIASEFGVSIATIGHIVSGLSFPDLPGVVSADDRKRLHFGHAKSPTNRKNMKLTDEQVLEIRARYWPRVVTAPQLAKQFNVSVPCIYSIVNGYSRKSVAA